MRKLTKHEYVTARLASLRQERSPYMEDWRDSSDFVMGIRPNFLRGQTEKGKRMRNESLYNERALYAANVLASGMMAGITSPARPWFKLGTPNPDTMEQSEVKEWLTVVERILMTIFSRSNFYRTMNEIYWELGIFGTAPIAGYTNFDTVARYENYTAGSYYLGMGANREIDTMYREYSVTVGQISKDFGLDKVSRAVKKLYEAGNYETKVPIIHVMEPNNDRDMKSPLSKNMRWASTYYEVGADKEGDPLAERGFKSKPFMAPRWQVIGDDTYSVIYPAANSMGTNKSLQVEEMDKAIATEKMHNPPLVGDSSLDGFLDLIAGGVSFAPNMGATGKPPLAPIYDVNPRIDHLRVDIQDKENRIDRAFFADLFLMLSNMDRAQITATEIIERKEEKLLMLGPVLERLNNELLDPIIDRTFELAASAGILPPAPEALQNVELKVEYISVLAQAQKAVSTSSMEATAAFAGQLAQFNPEAIDKIDLDQMIDEHGRAKGAPPKTIRSDDEVEAIRAQRQQAQQAQRQAEAAQAAVDGAQKLGSTPAGDGSVLDGILDSIGG